MKSARNFGWAILTMAAMLTPRAASAHFLWITAEPASSPGEGTTIQVFLNENAVPGGPQFLKFVQGVVPTSGGIPLPAAPSEESIAARWVGKMPAMIDAERDLGLKTKGETSYRLYYTARLQTVPEPITTGEKGDKLRTRLVTKDGKAVVQVNFDGQPVAKARIKATPEEGEPFETTTDDQGLVEVAGVAEGKTEVWANHVVESPGEVAGKPYSETRYYATLNFDPEAGTTGDPGKDLVTEDGVGPETAFATIPTPAVNSFGGAVLGDWLYVYSGHTGQTHQYSVETTSRKFRRLNLKDRTTWEELPMGRDVQGVALVTDGRYLYRVGGMSARNQPGQEHDLFSVADFSRFDPESKTWTDLAPLPDPRSTHDAVVIGRKVYAVGGWTMKGEKEKPTYLDDAVVFDLDAPEAGWKPFEQPFRRRALAAAEAGGKLYVLGGLTDIFKITRRVDVYDPSTDTWSIGPDLPGSGDRDGFAASAFGVEGRLYASVLSGTIVRLNEQGSGWEAIGAWALPRNTHRLLPGPRRSLLAVGGNYRGQQTPVIEAVRLEPRATAGARSGE